MKVLRVIGSLDPSLGGPGQGIRNTIPALSKIGVHSEVVTLDDPNAPFIAKDPFKIHAIGPATGPWQYQKALIPWLLEHLHSYDVVVIEGIWSYYSHAASQAVARFKEKNKSSKLRLLVMPHGMLDPYFQRAPERRLKAIRNWFYWKMIESKVINRADGLMFTCEEELLLARQPFRPYAPKEELNVGFGIQPPPQFHQRMEDEFYKACPQVANKSFILFLSRINEKKGVDLLIEGYAKARTSETPMLVIAGPGLDTSYGNKILALVERHDLQDMVVFPGMLSGDLKWGAFYSCEAFILPSHQENFGIAVVEALACHKPVLISNQVNIWKEIKAEGGGLVADDTPAGAQKLISEWTQMDSSQKKAMSTAARNAFEKLYAIEPVAERFLNAFKIQSSYKP